MSITPQFEEISLDLNNLFTMSYNFDSLKSLIQSLVKNQNYHQDLLQISIKENKQIIKDLRQTKEENKKIQIKNDDNNYNLTGYKNK